MIKEHFFLKCIAFPSDLILHELQDSPVGIYDGGKRFILKDKLRLRPGKQGKEDKNG